MSTVYINKEHRGQKYVIAVSCPANNSGPLMEYPPCSILGIEIFRKRRFWFAKLVESHLLEFIDENLYILREIFILREVKSFSPSNSLSEVCDQIWEQFVKDFEEKLFAGQKQDARNATSLSRFNELKKSLRP